MARSDTLTAYMCKFRYLHRNNPLLDEQRENIKSGNDPELTFKDFISMYSDSSTDILIGKNSDRAIRLSKDEILQRDLNGINSWYISPSAGKQGQPMTVVRPSTGEKHDFNSEFAALYDYHIFAYENENRMILIFYRRNSSGCKSVFFETANNVLRQKGLKLEMNLIVPLSDAVEDVTPTKITLQCVKRDSSSDAADNLRKKKTVIRDVGLNLEAHDNFVFARIIRNVQLRRMSKEEAFAQIKQKIDSIGDFNDAEVVFRVGNRTKKASWNTFENLIGAHDISVELEPVYSNSRDFVKKLMELSDKYYRDIIESGAIDNE